MAVSQNVWIAGQACTREISPVNPIPKRPTSTAPADRQLSSGARLGLAAKVALLALAVLAIYYPAFRGEWLWDDDLDVTKNQLLRSAAGLWKIWFQPTTLDYYPLKFSVQWLQWHLWGDTVLGYHLTNVCLHLLNAGLLWRVLEKLGVKLAWFGALLFAIHPLAVESVAWIAELKNCLALPPLLLAFDAWLDYEGHPRPSRYLLAAGWFLVSMLCKSSAVMFPCTLLLHTLMIRGRVSRADVFRTVPFFAISLVLGIVTLWLQHDRALQDAVIPLGGPLARIALGGATLGFYASKAVWPMPLLPIYPRWTIDPSAVWPFLPWLVFIAAAVWLWFRRSAGARRALFGLGWSVCHLLPFVGFVPISFMRFTWAMDHLTYLSLLGVCGLAAGSLGEAMERSRKAGQLVLISSATALAVAFAVLAQRHARRFASSRALWSHELQHNPDSATAHNNLGLALEAGGEMTAAIDHYRHAVQLDENFFEARTNLGNALSAARKPDEAIRELRLALDSRRNAAVAHYNLAFAYSAAGRTREAHAEFDQTLQLKPDWPEALYSRGVVGRELGRLDEAVRDLSAAVKLAPELAEAHNDLALTLMDFHRTAEASEELLRALQLRPNSAEFHNNFATVLAALGRRSEAIEHFRQAVNLRADYAEAQLNLGIALVNEVRPAEALPHLEAAARLQFDSVRARFNFGQALVNAGRNQEAVPQLEAALRLNPDHPLIHDNLGLALANLGRLQEAIAHFETALRLAPDLAVTHYHLALA